MTWRLAIALSLLGCTSLLCAQQPKVLAPHRPVPPTLPPTGKPHKAPELRSMIGGLWMTDANMKSTVYIKNIEKLYAITVSPTLYLSNGKALTLPALKLEPAGTASFNVNDALRDMQVASWATLFGYVEIQYTFPWDPICVTIQNVDAAHSVIFTSGLRSRGTVGTSTIAPHMIEGMWWKQENNVTGFVTLSNTTSQTLNATVDSSDSRDNSIAHHAVAVSPHGTKLVELQELASAIAVGGIRVRYDGPEDGILVNGDLEDLSKGYSATIPFLPTTFPADPRPSVTFAELGLMTGAADPMMKFPAGTVFTPYSIVRNISDQPLSVALSLYWMEGGAAKAAQLQRLTIPPHQTEDLNAPSLIALSGLKNFNGSVSLILDVQGNPYSLLMTGGSVDQTDSYVFESLPSAAAESAGKAVSRWTIDKGDDTMVTMWNPADEAQDVVFTMYFSGGHYKYPIHLGPRATHMFNVSEIAQDQLPDADGNIIPSGMHEGSAEITGPLGPEQHILVAAEASSYNVQKATCGWFCLTCYGVVETWIADNPFAIGASGQTQLSFIEEWSGGLGDLDFTKGTGVTWSSNHTNIATVSAGLTTGVSTGSAEVSVAAPKEFVPGQSCGAPPTACSQPLQPVTPPPAPGDVCDFTITPANVLASDCTGAQQNSNNFNTTITPAGGYCLADQVQSSCSAKRASGGIDISPGSPQCVFNLGNPSANVKYFAGPKLPDGTAGTIDMTFDLVFNGTSVMHTDTATVECP